MCVNSAFGGAAGPRDRYPVKLLDDGRQ
jgi:hypothetical protein